VEWLIVAQSVNTRSDTRSAMMRFGLESYAAAVECSTGLNVGPLGSVIKCNLRVKKSLGSMILTDIDKADTG